MSNPTDIGILELCKHSKKLVFNWQFLADATLLEKLSIGCPGYMRGTLTNRLATYCAM